jgi:hypothetical protein
MSEKKKFIFKKQDKSKKETQFRRENIDANTFEDEFPDTSFSFDTNGGYKKDGSIGKQFQSYDLGVSGNSGISGSGRQSSRDFLKKDHQSEGHDSYSFSGSNTGGSSKSSSFFLNSKKREGDFKAPIEKKKTNQSDALINIVDISSTPQNNPLNRLHSSKSAGSAFSRTTTNISPGNSSSDPEADQVIQQIQQFQNTINSIKVNSQHKQKQLEEKLDQEKQKNKKLLEEHKEFKKQETKLAEQITIKNEILKNYSTRVERLEKSRDIGLFVIKRMKVKMAEFNETLDAHMQNQKGIFSITRFETL